MNEYKISVIVPIYGVEKYIGRCAESLFSQTMTEGVEYLFINDCTNDLSIERLQEVIGRHPELKNQIFIINHAVNKGLPSARNTGLEAAHGEYIIHIDGDDYCEPNALSQLYESAIENNSDFVWCDYYITFEKKRRVISQPCYHTPPDAVKGMLQGVMKYNVWNKLCRRSIYKDNGITFPEGYSMGEDLTMIMVALNASRCSFVKEPLYNYVQSDSQMTACYTDRKLEELSYNCKRITGYIESEFPEWHLESEYSALQLLMKWPFLLDGKLSSFRRWLEWFPESGKYIWQTKGVCIRIKIVEWCASKGLFGLVWLHYLLVIKIFYGLAYGADNGLSQGR